MNADKKSFTEFIAGDVTCVVPVYQRNYDWKQKHCQRLFDDIKHIIENDAPHFIGTFVYKAESDGEIFSKYIIIDGQQRITSIILFARALYEFADDELKSKINAKFLCHILSGEPEKYRLLPSEYDRDIFAKIMSGDISTENEKSVMYNNYKFFYEQIAASAIAPQKFFNAIHKFNVVSIRLDENENAQEIFESLNSTGLDLTQADLIRNFLLMNLNSGQQETLYKNYWLEIEKMLHSSDNVENFIVQYLIAKRKSNADGVKQLSKNYLYAVFKEYSKRFSDVEACLLDMLRYAKFFKRCIFDADTVFENLPALDKKFYELTFLLKATNTPIILMHLLDRYEKNNFDETTFIKFVDALISFAFRAKVCNRNGIDQQTAGNILSRLGNSLDEKSFWRAITGGKSSYTFPNNEDFQAALTSNTLGDRLKVDGFKYFLYALEKNSAQNLPAYSEILVEHVMPKKLNDAWKNYLIEQHDFDNAELWVNASGNLVLVCKKGTESFVKKKFRYGDSVFSHTQELNAYTYWTSKQIQARTRKLAKEALKLWILPEEFNVTIQSTENIFDLDSDFSKCTGEKPSTLSIDGDTKQISNWREFVHEIVKKLYAIDENIFRQATRSDNVPKRKNLFTTKPTNIKIADDYYMTLDGDTISCLKIAKTLVENFDRLGETNFKENIWFTLKRE